MPSLIDIRRRIRSVKNTQQITKAMKMVSAAKLRRAQDRVIAARPYAATLHDLLSDVIAAVPSTDDDLTNALLDVRPEKRIQLILLTSDRGLAGAFNSNLIKGAQRFVAEHPDATVEMITLGRKGRDFFRKRGFTLTSDMTGIFDKPSYSTGQDIGKMLVQRMRDGQIDAVYMVYNTFKSVVAQKLTISKLLPVTPPEGKGEAEFIFEQPASEMLAKLLPKYIEVQLYTAILESSAAEHAARMTAMDAASSNAADVIDRLTLYMNRVRQASITREIIEVVSGASALE